MYEEVCVRIAAFVRRANGCVLPWLGMRWVNTLIRCGKLAQGVCPVFSWMVV